MPARSRRSIAASTNLRYRPQLETVEDRTVPTVGPFDGAFQVLENTPLMVAASATQVVETNDGEVTLPASAGSEFFGTALPADWQVTSWSPTGTGSATVGAGVLTVDGAQAGVQTIYNAGRTLKFRATFSGDAHQHVGFGTDFDVPQWMIFSTGSSGGQLFARTNNGSTSENTPLAVSLGTPHDFQIEWTATGAIYSVDGVQVTSHSLPVTTALRPLVGDFGVGGGTVVVDSINLIPPDIEIGFDGTSLPPDWFTTTGPVASVNLGQMTVNGGLVGTQSSYAPGRSLEFRATFDGAPFQNIGFGTNLSGPPWLIIGTGSVAGQLVARTNNGSTSTETPLPAVSLGVPHDFRIDWTVGGAAYYVDGVLVATHSTSVATPLRIVVSDFQASGGGLSVDWVRMSPFRASGSYLSRVFDAGTAVSWASSTVDAVMPTGTSIVLTVRTGNTPTPDETWTEFAVLSGSGASTSRYAQYRADLASTDPNLTPTLRSVTLTTASPVIHFTDTTVSDFVAGTHGLGLLADDGPATNGPYTAVLVTNVSHGVLALDPDGTFTYTPATDFIGTDSFVYRARGADGTLSEPHTVTLNVFDPVTPPTLTVATASGNEGNSIPLAISAALTGYTSLQTLSIAISGLPAGATLSHGTLSAGVWTLTPAELTGLTFTAPDNGTFALAVTATAQSVVTGATLLTTTTLDVTVANVAPTAAIADNGPVTYSGLTTVTLNSPFDPSAADTAAGLRYAFALTSDALTTATYATSGTVPTASYSLNAGTHTLYARVFDKDGGFTPYQIVATVNKALLTVTADATTKVYGAAVPTLTASYSGFVNGESVSSLTTPVALTTAATLTSPVGIYAITASGASAQNYTIAYLPGVLTVTSPTRGAAFVAADPTKPGTNALFVSGTAGADQILIAKADLFGSTVILVHIGNAAGGWSEQFVFTGQLNRIVVHGQEGNDDVWALGPSSVSTWLYGGDGNDRLLGESDNNVLLGGNGDDLLVGGSGRDLLIGGSGADRILGGGGDDILVGGTTQYDADETALSYLMGIWVGSNTFTNRVASLSNTASPYYLVQGISVFNDNRADVFSGNGGSDWFLAEAVDTITDLSSADRAFISRS